MTADPDSILACRTIRQAAFLNVIFQNRVRDLIEIFRALARLLLSAVHMSGVYVVLAPVRTAVAVVEQQRLEKLAKENRALKTQEIINLNITSTFKAAETYAYEMGRFEFLNVC